MAACGSARWCATPILRTIPLLPAASQLWPRRCCRVPRRNLRNAATVGGNLLQRTRCAYFYDVASACNKRDPGSGCDARGGENRLHAVLGWSEHCIATHPSDFCVPLVALDAVVEIEGRDRPPRGAAGSSFICLPGDTPERESVLEPGELIVAVRLPAEAAAFAAHARYLKVRERTSYAFAVVSAAAALAPRGRPDRGGAAGARRRRRQALAGPRGGSDAWTARSPDAVAFRRAAEARARRRRPSGDNALQDRTGAPRSSARALTLAAAGTPARVPALPASPFAPLPERRPCLTSASTQAPAHIRQGSNIGQPLTRRDGVLKVTGAARYAADNHPPGMLYAVLAVSSIARGRVAALDVAGGEGASRRGRGHDARQPAAARAGSGREAAIPSCSGSICCRTTACATPTSRSRW